MVKKKAAAVTKSNAKPKSMTAKRPDEIDVMVGEIKADMAEFMKTRGRSIELWMRIGERLRKARKKLKTEQGHGHWEGWLTTNFELSGRTARRMMQMAKNKDAILEASHKPRNLSDAFELIVRPRKLVDVSVKKSPKPKLPMTNSDPKSPIIIDSAEPGIVIDACSPGFQPVQSSPTSTVSDNCTDALLSSDIDSISAFSRSCQTMAEKAEAIAVLDLKMVSIAETVLVASAAGRAISALTKVVAAAAHVRPALTGRDIVRLEAARLAAAGTQGTS